MRELENNLIILILGARQLGKTTVLKQIRDAISVRFPTYFLNLEDPDIKKYLDIHPNKLFDITGSDPKQQQVIFIDEIQYLQNPSNVLKYLYDEYKDTVKLIVSGSSSFYIDQTFKDSLMGRKRILHMYSLDFEEFLAFKQETQILQSFFIDKKIPLLLRDRLHQLFLEYCTYGGYPEVVLLDTIQQKQQRLSEFAFDYVKKDIYDANIADRDKFVSILKILAHQTGELVNMNEIANTINLSMPTVEKYLTIMQKSFHIALIKPFHNNIRKELTKMPKCYFYDMGLRNSLIGDFSPVYTRQDRGGCTENIVMRELLFQYGLEQIAYWRTQQQHEIDFIIKHERRAIEVKFQSSGIKPTKYKVFERMYPEYSLEFVVFDDILTKIMMGR